MRQRLKPLLFDDDATAAEPFEIVTRPTALQREVFKLLGVRLERSQ